MSLRGHGNWARFLRTERKQMSFIFKKGKRGTLRTAVLILLILGAPELNTVVQGGSHKETPMRSVVLSALLYRCLRRHSNILGRDAGNTESKVMRPASSIWIAMSKRVIWEVILWINLGI